MFITLSSVKTAPTKQIQPIPTNTNLIPYIKASALPSMYPVTLYPILLLILLYKRLVERAIPVVVPKFLTNPFILPAIPSLVLSTVDIINELFGDWNIPLPKDNNPTNIATTISAVYSVNIVKQNTPMFKILNPIADIF